MKRELADNNNNKQFPEEIDYDSWCAKVIQQKNLVPATNAVSVSFATVPTPLSDYDLPIDTLENIFTFLDVQNLCDLEYNGSTTIKDRKPCFLLRGQQELTPNYSFKQFVA